MDNSILIVDDEANVLSAIKRALIDEPYYVHRAGSGAEALGILKEHSVKLVISDEQMPGMSGSELLTAVKQMFPETIRIMLTGHASIKSAMNAVNSGEIYRFFTKPWHDIELKLAIRSAIEKYDLEAENRKLIETVRIQEAGLRLLEQKHPGITRLDRDESGTLILPGDVEEDLSGILSECETTVPKGRLKKNGS